MRPRENLGRLRLPVRRFATPAALRTGLTSTGRQLRIKSVISAYLFLLFAEFAYVAVEYCLFFSKEEQDKVAVDKVAADVARQERMNKPVMPELVEREQPEHLREYFHERFRVHRLNSQQLPRANAPEYNKPGDDQQN
uniref:DNA polymerase III theta subunit n=1 Tax=Klebsiella pneumoniae TaxID=573 RepID=A0A8B0SSY5_KLEPN|nr:DNA polymerase III theta subunit [Klebsiella pneumoniae]